MYNDKRDHYITRGNSCYQMTHVCHYFSYVCNSRSCLSHAAQKRTMDLTRRLEQAEDTMKMATAGGLGNGKRNCQETLSKQKPKVFTFIVK